MVSLNASDFLCTLQRFTDIGLRKNGECFTPRTSIRYEQVMACLRTTFLHEKHSPEFPKYRRHHEFTKFVEKMYSSPAELRWN